MKKILTILMCICFGIMGSAAVACAANPRVMVSDYKVKEGEVVAGKDFTLTIILKNTAAKAVKNIKLTISTENGELLPVKGAGTAYVEQMEAGGEENFTFQMRAANGLEEKSYKLSLKTEYESSGGMEYTVDENIFLSVSLEQRLSVTDIFVAEEQIEVGDTVEISAVVNNLGEGSLYNVAAYLTGDNLQENKTYVGNIESGKSGTIDMLTKAAVVTEGDHRCNEMIITYEDKEGNVYEEKTGIDVMVIEPVYDNLEKVKEEKDYTKVIKKIVEIVVMLAVFAALVWIYMRRKKKKQQMLDDFIN